MSLGLKADDDYWGPVVEVGRLHADVLKFHEKPCHGFGIPAEGTARGDARPARRAPPRAGRRQRLLGHDVEGGADAGKLRLDDGRLFDAEAADYLPPVAPSKIIAVHIS